MAADAIQDDWTATVDGERVEIRDADHAVAAVAVPAGRHVVEFSATPRGWRTGIALSIGSVIVLALVTAWGLLQRRRSRRSAAGEASPVATVDDQSFSSNVDSK